LPHQSPPASSRRAPFFIFTINTLKKRVIMTLTKAELAEILSDKAHLPKRDGKDFVELFFEEIRLALESGDAVKLSGFGNFELRTKPERPGRNPKTGEEVAVSARRVVTFHASQKLKTMVEQKNAGKTAA
jgi:integration host factor subunit alpha